MSIGDFPESLSQAILAGIILVGRLNITCRSWRVMVELWRAYFARSMMDIYVYVYAYKYIYIYIYIYNTRMLYIFISLSIYIYIEREREI